jgi:hypothetical protein
LEKNAVGWSGVSFKKGLCFFNRFTLKLWHGLPTTAVNMFAALAGAWRARLFSVQG